MVDPSILAQKARLDTSQNASMGQLFANQYAQTCAHGHFDELRGVAFEAPNSSRFAPLAPIWDRFLSHWGAHGLDQLNQKHADLKQQIHSNGITYNVHAYAGAAQGPTRPWSLDLFPFLLSGQEWQAIEEGVLQRARVLEGIMTDVYGPQTLLRKALLPAALTQGHRGYLRAMHGAKVCGGRHLHVVAFDIARSPEGQWWVVSQRTQAPSGLGYLLENRSIVSRLFDASFKSEKVRNLAPIYRSFVTSMREMSPGGPNAHIALLTPGPYSETYFEHAYLARQLGLTLVEGTDLTVRQQKLYLKTIHGLEPIHGLIKRLDDEFLDPLELRSDSALGVPGLMQCIRAGNVLVANAPGSEFLESPAILGFMPGIAEELLGQTLLMPALPTWWCGERAALDAVLPRLASSVIKPSYPNEPRQQQMHAMLGKYMGASQRDELAGRMLRDGNAYTVQSYMPLSQMPTWQGGRIVPKSALLRVYAVCDATAGWRALPGGLMRIAAGDQEIASMQNGGSSADVWVGGSDDTPSSQSLRVSLSSPSVNTADKRLVTSRAAENLFWLGRYSERAECGMRIALHILHYVRQMHLIPADSAMQGWLSSLALQNSLVIVGVPSLAQSARVFERSLITAMHDVVGSYSIGFNLQALRNAAFQVRARLSQEQWDLIASCEREFAKRGKQGLAHGADSSQEAIALLTATSLQLAAITGAQTDRMMRDDGWRLLSAGRLLERLQFLASTLLSGLQHGTFRFNSEDGVAIDIEGFEAMLALFDSTTTYRAHHGHRADMAAVLETLVLDQDNPRSIAWVIKTLRGRLAKLSGDRPQDECPLSLMLADVSEWQITDLVRPNSDGRFENLITTLRHSIEAVNNVTQAISAQYFTHSSFPESTWGA